MRARKQASSERRRQIAEAALAVLGGHRGGEAMSLGAIAARVGIVPSGIYRHYESLDAILDQVVELVRRRLLDNVAAVRAATADPVAQLHELLIRHAAMLSESPALPRLLLGDGLIADSPDRRQQVRAVIAAYLAEVAAIVADGQRTGVFRDDLKPPTVALLFLGLLLPGAMLAQAEGPPFDLNQHVRLAWPIFRRGLTPE